MIYVDGKTYSTAVGLELAIFGGFFDDDCGVKFGTIDAEILSVTDDCITCLVPETAGKYAVYVTDGHGASVFAGNANVSTLTDYEKIGCPADYKFKDFLGYVNGLLPKTSSILFTSEFRDYASVTASRPLTCGFFGKMLWAIAYSIQCLFGYIRAVAAAINPLTTSNFDTWENDLALPIKGIEQTTDEGRKKEIIRIACSKGGCTKNYFKKILKIVGVDAEIYEYWSRPDLFGTVPVSDDEKNFYWMIRENDENPVVRHLKCNGKCNMPLSWWTETFIKDLFNKIKPSHTRLLFAKKWTRVHYNLVGDSSNLIGGGYNLVGSRLEDLVDQG